MKKIILILTLMTMTLSGIQAKTAVVVITHGAPMQSWNKPVFELEKAMQSYLKTKGIKGIDHVRFAMMEFVQPTVAEVVRDCERQGIDTIFAIPLFIAPSSHSDEDIPNILGLQYNSKVVSALKEEKTELVKTKIKIILGTPLSYSNVLEEVMLERVQQMSKKPEDEAVILLAHGDYTPTGSGRTGLWEEMMKNISKYIKSNTKIDDVQYNFVAMGYYLDQDLSTLIKKAASKKKRILIQGVYLSTSMQSMAKMAKMEEKQADFGDVEIVYSDKAIIPQSSDKICQWIVNQVESWQRDNKTNN